MVIKRASNCPLCGAKMTALELLDACTEFIDPHLGILEAHCPYCQGYLEVMPSAGQVDIGYRVADVRFDSALSLPCDGLVVERTAGSMALKTQERSWAFPG